MVYGVGRRSPRRWLRGGRRGGQRDRGARPGTPRMCPGTATDRRHPRSLPMTDTATASRLAAGHRTGRAGAAHHQRDPRPRAARGRGPEGLLPDHQRRAPTPHRLGRGRRRRVVHHPTAARRSGWSASRARARRPSAGRSCASRTRIEGSVTLDGEDLLALKGEELRRRRRRFQMVFQDPYSSLDPRQTVGEILAEPLRVHGLASGSGPDASASRSC